jgi:hypothetical protein
LSAAFVGLNSKRFVAKGSARRAIAPLLTLAAIVALCGCSSSSSTAAKPQVVSIFFTDANGNTLSTQPSSLTVASGAYLDVTITNDTSNLGADWTVTCASAPAPGTPLPPGVTVDDSCGTFTPVHTMSAPVPSFATSGTGYVTLYTPPAAPPKGGTVTIYAAATADPSRFASLTLTIAGLPISIGFAPQPPASLAVNGTTPLKAVVSNDYVAGGVSWAVTCKSSACGTISPAQTASGVATTYTAPAAPPTGGSVTITATSVTDSTKSATATINIAPIAVAVAPATLSVVAGATGLLNATVAFDASNAGVDWTVTCGTAGACGSITTHTASGAPATYTAPSAVPTGGTVTVTATSSADHTTSGSSIVTVTAAPTPSVSGIVRVGLLPVSGATVSLYAAGEAGYGSASRLLRTKEAVVTNADGSFTVSVAEACSGPASLLYVAASQGNVAGAELPGLALVTALGPCSSFATASGVTVNEATTVAAAYALTAFAVDAAHIGSTSANYEGIEKAFATSHDLVDTTTGQARATTVAGDASVPQREINSLADALHQCLLATTASQDAAACSAVFAGSSSALYANTFQSALALSRNAAGVSSSLVPAKLLYELSDHNGPFQPSLSEQPQDWMIRLSFPAAPAAAGATLTWSANSIVDGSGATWTASEINGEPEPLRTAIAGRLKPVEQTGRFKLGVDSSGNLWVSDLGGRNFSEFPGAATPPATAPSLTVDVRSTERQP